MPISDSMPAAAPRHTAVVGLQWGDEGKGKLVDILASDHDFIVRYNGGANAVLRRLANHHRLSKTGRVSNFLLVVLMFV